MASGWSAAFSTRATARVYVRLCRERNGPRSAERLPESRDHHEVGVLPDADEAAHAERCQSVLALEPSELALYGRAATVEALPLVRPVRDRRKRDRAALP